MPVKDHLHFAEKAREEHLFFKDRRFKVPNASFMSEALATEVSPYVSHKKKYECKIPQPDSKRDTFYRKGGTYKTDFPGDQLDLDTHLKKLVTQ